MSHKAKIQGRYTRDDGWQQDLAPITDTTAWHAVPLPPCPDCGGDMIWYEARYVPGTRRCMGKPMSEGEYGPEYCEDNGCGSMFSVTTRQGRVFVRRERFYC